MLQCKQNNLKTWSELTAIMNKFIKSEQVRSKVARNSVEEGKESQGEEEEVKVNEIPLKEYDFLLSMPLWSLTEEKVVDLEN